MNIRPIRLIRVRFKKSFKCFQCFILYPTLPHLPENQLLGQSNLVECKQPATQVLQRGTDMIHIIVNDQESVMKTPPPHEEAGLCGQKIQFVPHYVLSYPPCE